MVIYNYCLFNRSSSASFLHKTNHALLSITGNNSRQIPCSNTWSIGIAYCQVIHDKDSITRWQVKAPQISWEIANGRLSRCQKGGKNVQLILIAMDIWWFQESFEASCANQFFVRNLFLQFDIINHCLHEMHTKRNYGERVEFHWKVIHESIFVCSLQGIVVDEKDNL